MRIGICDDNKKDLETIREVFRRASPGQEPDTFSDGKELLAAISEGAEYDLLFLDVIMSGLGGLELASELGRITPETQLVFLTGSDAYAVEAFSVNALHYIVKPMTEPALQECLRRASGKRSSRKRIHIVSSSGIQQMPFADEIQFAQSDAHYWKLHLNDGTVIRTRMTQAEIQAALGDLFLSISRGLLVNMDFIRQLGPKSCTLEDGRTVLLSRTKLKAIHNAYAAYVFSQLPQGDGLPQAEIPSLGI